MTHPGTKKSAAQRPSGAQQRKAARERAKADKAAQVKRSDTLLAGWSATGKRLAAKMRRVPADGIGTARATLAALRETMAAVLEDPTVLLLERLDRETRLANAVAKLTTPALYEDEIERLRKQLDGDGAAERIAELEAEVAELRKELGR